MTSDTIINGKTQTSLLRFFSGEAAVTQANMVIQVTFGYLSALQRSSIIFQWGVLCHAEFNFL